MRIRDEDLDSILKLFRVRLLRYFERRWLVNMDCEDMLQECVVHMLQLPEPPGNPALSTVCYKVVDWWWSREWWRHHTRKGRSVKADDSEELWRRALEVEDDFLHEWRRSMRIQEDMEEIGPQIEKLRIRNLEVLKRRFNGDTYAEIGADYGITRQRAEQIASRALLQLQAEMRDLRSRKPD